MIKRRGNIWLSGGVIWFTFLVIGVIVFQFNSQPLKLTYDSLDYLAASESINTYFTGKNADGVPYLHRPPLLPWYLHFFSDKVSACLWLNILSYSTSLLLCFRIGGWLRITPIFLYTALVVIAFNYPWLQNHFFLWTEPLFTVFVLWLVVSLVNNTRLSVVLAICIIAFFLRKSGLFLTAGVVGWYAFNKNWKGAAMIACVMLFTVAGWEYITFYFSDVSTSYNILSSMGPLGRAPYVDVLTSWFTPRMISLPYRVALVLLTILCIVFFHRPSVEAYFRRIPIQLVWIILLIYLLCYIIFFGVPDYHEAERYLSIVLPLTMIAVFSFWSDVHNGFTSEVKRKILVVAMLAWCLYPVTRTISHFLL